MKRFFFILATVFLVLIVACLAGEIILRVYNKVRPLPYFSDDALVKYRGRPFEKVFGYPLNSKGFKDKEYPLSRPEGSYRILAVGDSFAFGAVPYPENYLTLLEDHLNADSKQHYEVINMGIPATEPPDYLRLIKTEGMDYNPDMVLLSLFMGNDFYFNLERNMSPKKPVSYLYTFLSNTFTIFKSINIMEIFTEDSVNDVSSLSKCQLYTVRLKMNMEKFVWLSNGTPKILTNERDFKVIQHNMAAVFELDRLLKQRGVELVIVLIPEESQINREIRNFIKLNVKNSSRDSYVDFSLPNKTFKPLFFANVKTIDMYDEFLVWQDMAPVSFYIECDGHWNKEGNAVAAEIIYKHLLEFLPARK